MRALNCKCGNIPSAYEQQVGECYECGTSLIVELESVFDQSGTAAEREAEYKAAQAHADELKEAWHAALIAESPFRVGDRVRHRRTGYVATVLGLFVAAEHVVIQYHRRDGGQDWLGESYWQRIDEHEARP